MSYDLLLPGDITGLVQPCSWVRCGSYRDEGVVVGPDARVNAWGEWVVAPADEWSDCTDETECMQRSWKGHELGLDLTHRTSRAHAAWWGMAHREQAAPWLAWLNPRGIPAGPALIERLKKQVPGEPVIGTSVVEHEGQLYAQRSPHIDLRLLWANLDPHDTRTLADGSRWVEVRALVLLVLHVAGVAPRVAQP